MGPEMSLRKEIQVYSIQAFREYLDNNYSLHQHEQGQNQIANENLIK